MDTPTPDASLVAMAAELRAFETDYNTGCGTSDEFCKSAEGEADLINSPLALPKAA